MFSAFKPPVYRHARRVRAWTCNHRPRALRMTLPSVTSFFCLPLHVHCKFRFRPVELQKLVFRSVLTVASFCQLSMKLNHTQEPDWAIRISESSVQPTVHAHPCPSHRGTISRSERGSRPQLAVLDLHATIWVRMIHDPYGREWTFVSSCRRHFNTPSFNGLLGFATSIQCPFHQPNAEPWH